ncbi:unnamed protein product [Blepharisma stoltei]|uniref:Uncharacterized protein n=1 Tax=Blepharisma stoltei TaxID=1481888 RepID=A0AAU9KBA5_9CILI|nr:unnamed protein product [Blepharisma stoltei]
MGLSRRIIVFLALLKTISARISFFDEWLTNSGYLNGNDKMTSNDNNDLLVTKPSTDLTNKFSCFLMVLNGETWDLEGDFSSRVSGNEVAVGYWVKFSNTVSNKVFQFGFSSGPHYIISSVSNGVLNGVFYKDASTTDPKNNFSFTIPINKWNLVVFYFQQINSDVTLNILISNKGKTSITSDASSSTPFQLPQGYMTFSSSVHGFLYSIFAIASAYFEGTEYREVILKDTNLNVGKQSKVCSQNCADDLCDAEGDCISSYSQCHCATGTTVCDSCSEPARDFSNYCLRCKYGNSFKNHHCCSNTLTNCLDCSPLSATVCTLCSTGYFLYNNGAGTVSCISCTDSCTSCNPNPQCFECASSIVQDGSTCRVDSIGFQIGFSKPNFEINFASPLTYDLTISSIKAFSDASPSTLLTTTGWTLNTCNSGASQCNIVTDLTESQLPISLVLEFNQA